MRPFGVCITSEKRPLEAVLESLCGDDKHSKQPQLRPFVVEKRLLRQFDSSDVFYPPPQFCQEFASVDIRFLDRTYIPHTLDTCFHNFMRIAASSLVREGCLDANFIRIKLAPSHEGAFSCESLFLTKEMLVHTSWWDGVEGPIGGGQTPKKKKPSGDTPDDGKPSPAERRQQAVADEQAELEGRRPVRKKLR